MSMLKLLQKLNSIDGTSSATKINESLGGGESGWDAYEQMKDRISSVLVKLYHQGEDSETIGQMRDRVARHLGYNPEDPMFKDAWSTSFTDASLDGLFDEPTDDEYTDHSMRQGEMGRYGDTQDEFESNEAFESMGPQGDIGGAHGEDSISPVHGEDVEEDLTLESLKMLSGIKDTLAECGISMASPMGAPHTPASINITAGSGSELTGMLKDLLNLAGTQHTSSQHVPLDTPAGPISIDHPTSGPSMKDLIAVIDEPETSHDSMNDEQPEDEGMIGAGLGGLAGGTAGELAGGALGTAVGGPIGGMIGTAVGNVAGTALGAKAGDKLTGEEFENGRTDNRQWDSSPREKIGADGVRKFGDLNTGDHRERQKGLPVANPVEEAVSRLFADYQKFMSEDK